MSEGPARVRDVVARVFEAFPAEWAEPWDKVGLVVGDPDAQVRGVLVTLDPTPHVLHRAADMGASLVVTHHPPFLEQPKPLFAPGAAGVPALALSLGLSIVVAHTNLDRAPAGGDALCSALGFHPLRALESSPQPMSVVTTYAPPSHAETIIDAMSLAGAGRVGLYEECAFVAAGEGRFVPLPGSAPLVGTIDEPSRSEELRIEMVSPKGATNAVVAAAIAAHPYDEPLVIANDAFIGRGAARLGRLCALPEGCSLGRLASLVGERLGVTPRVWGDIDSPVRLAATATGSGSSVIDDSLRESADVLVTGEVRYHDATNALDRGLAVIEAGHDATEWPLVPVLADAILGTPGLTVERVSVDEPRIRWWTPETSNS